MRQARAQRQGFAWRVYVHQWSRVTERNCLVCLACLCLASLRQDLAVMPGAGFDFRRRGQCGDVCWDACGLSASGVWTILGVLHVFQRRCGVSVKLCNAKFDHENRFQNLYAQSKPKPKQTQTCKSRVSAVSKPSEAVSRQHTHTHFSLPGS